EAVRARLEHRVAGAGGGEARQQRLHLGGLGGGEVPLLGRQLARAQVGGRRARQPRLVARQQQPVQQVAGGGLAVGAGHAQHAQAPAGVAVEGGRQVGEGGA